MSRKPKPVPCALLHRLAELCDTAPGALDVTPIALWQGLYSFTISQGGAEAVRVVKASVDEVVAQQQAIDAVFFLDRRTLLDNAFDRAEGMRVPAVHWEVVAVNSLANSSTPEQRQLKKAYDHLADLVAELVHAHTAAKGPRVLAISCRLGRERSPAYFLALHVALLAVFARPGVDAAHKRTGAPHWAAQDLRRTITLKDYEVTRADGALLDALMPGVSNSARAAEVDAAICSLLSDESCLSERQVVAVDAKTTAAVCRNCDETASLAAPSRAVVWVRGGAREALLFCSGACARDFMARYQ